MNKGWFDEIDDELVRALEACAQEPLAFPGAIQSSGFLFVVEPSSQIIVAASENVGALTGVSFHHALGKRLAEVLGSEWSDGILDYSSILREQRAGPRLIPHVVTRDELSWGVLVNLSSNRLLTVEFFPFDIESSHRLSNNALIEFSELLENIKELEEVFELAVQFVARATGYEHVMLYRFEADWHGVVVGEHRCDEAIPTFHGLHFPASDIPPQARALYLDNPVRVIWNAAEDPVALRFMPPSELVRVFEHQDFGIRSDTLVAEQFDLSYALSRAVSPVHRRYLLNMGVSSSMSISLVQGGRLWGLIAAHHNAPLLVNLDGLVLAKFIGSLVAHRIKVLEDDAQRSAVRRKDSELSIPLDFMDRPRGMQEFLEKYHWMVMNWFDACGFVVRFESELLTFGDCPSPVKIQALLEFLEDSSEDEIFHTDMLSGLGGFENWTDPQYSGILALRVPPEPNGDIFIWFRPEYPQVVYWGGEPKKDITREEGVLRLNPRKSFEAWRQEYRLCSRAWGANDVAVAHEFGRRMKALKMSSFLERKVMDDGRSETLSYVLHDLGNTVVGLSSKLFDLKSLGDAGLTVRAFRDFLMCLTALKEESGLSAATISQISCMQEMLEGYFIEHEKNEVQRKRLQADFETLLQHAGTLLEVNRKYVSKTGSIEDASCGLAETVQGISVFFPSTLRARGGSFEVHMSIEDVTVSVRQSVLERVLVNLLKNALKACSKVGAVPEIVCTISRVGGGHGNDFNDFVRVCMVDNGCGFNSQDDPLRSSSELASNKGFGLSLKGCQRLIRQAGGDLKILSNGPGQGACVILDLPYLGESPLMALNLGT